MTITLYQNISDAKAVNKILTAALDVSGTAKDPLDVVDPEIEIEGDITNLAMYNYMYIPDYNRYYFIKPTADYYNLNTVVGHCDVLMSAKNQLNAKTATVTRSEKFFNGYMVDNDMPAMSYKSIVTRVFPQGITNDSIVLMTVG